MRAYKSDWIDADPKKAKERQKIYLRTSRYGLSLEEQEALPKECGICGDVENLHVDHDHETGFVRGVLCRNHNIGMSYFKDNPELLMRAAEYLLGHFEGRLR